MKKTVGLFFCLFALCLFFNSCKKDRDDSPKNYLKYGDVDFELSQGILMNMGKPNRSEVNHWGLAFLSSGFVIHESDGLIDSLSGAGHAISFEIYTSGSDKLDLGNYFYNKESFLPKTLKYVDAVLNYNSQLEEGDEIVINNGVLTVKMNVPEYEITFVCQDVDGESVAVYYKGPVKYYNVENVSMSARLKSGYGIR